MEDLTDTNPLRFFFGKVGRVPLTYHLVSTKSRKQKSKNVRKSIESELHRTDRIILERFHKPISKLVR